MTLGDLIKQYRGEHNLSMDDFSKKSNISKGYISMLEKNKNPKTNQSIVPSFETLKNVANAMDYDIDVLINILYPEQPVMVNTFSTSTPENILIRLKDMAKKVNKSIYIILKECGINSYAIHTLKCGAYPKLEILLKLAKYFDCSVDYIICRTDNEHSEYIPTPKTDNTLSSDEETLVTNYRELNNDGKDKAQEYISDLKTIEKYTAPEEPQSKLHA